MISSSSDATEVLVAFARMLRGYGISVGGSQIVRYCKSLPLIDPNDVVDLYWMGRACLVSDAADRSAYDLAFAEFFLADEPFSMAGVDQTARIAAETEGTEPRDQRTILREGLSGNEKLDSEEDIISDEAGARASESEHLRHRSFADWTESELVSMAQVIAAIQIHVPRRRSRRLKPSSRSEQLDMRRTIRYALRNEGELLQRMWRRRVTQPRRLLVMIDVSGSMSSHSRAMLHFAYALVNSGLQSEVFCFGTRLTRATASLRQRDPDTAVDRVSAAVEDWAGGTRIGESLSAFLSDPAYRTFVRGSVVLVASDGLEVGEPYLMATQVGRLSRLAHTLIWMNPLKADPAYVPVTRGLQMSLPYLDRLLAADSISDLETVADLIPVLARKSQ